MTGLRGKNQSSKEMRNHSNYINVKNIYFLKDHTKVGEKKEEDQLFYVKI
jgi:hypothetical protein